LESWFVRSFIQPGDRIFVHGAAATPATVLEALADDHERLKGCEVMHIHTHGSARYADFKEFKVTNLFVGENLRKKLDYDRLDYLPCYTEMFSDGLISLIESGVVDNSRKAVHAGKTVTSFVNGSEKFFAFVHDNPSMQFLETDYVNRSANIARNSNVVAINSAVEVDLTGQVVADSVGHRIVSGVGGQMDFIRGANLSPGERARELIKIAHPEDRELLIAGWKKCFSTF
jgi:acyl-CoA hydrolase